MVIYILVLAVVVVGLTAAYRTLGGATHPVADPAELLWATCRSLHSSLADLTAAAAAGEGDIAGLLQSGRRSIGAAQHCLDLIPGERELTADQRVVRGLLTDAVAGTTWAWRMVVSTDWSANRSLRSAVAVLGTETTRLHDDAVALLPPPREPVQRAP